MLLIFTYICYQFGLQASPPFQEGLFSIEPWGEQVDFFSLAVSGQTSTHQETTLQNGFHNSGLF